jgi:hypothetical protein
LGPLSDGGEIATYPSKPFTIEGILNSVSKVADSMKEEKNSADNKSQAPTAISPKLGH